MTKQRITKAELEDLLTTQIQKIEGCGNCTFSGIMGLQEPDSEGCNWSDSVTLSTAGVPQQTYEAAAKSIIRTARQKYNISD